MITREEKALQQRSRAEGIREFAGRAICMNGFAGDDAVRVLLGKEEIDPRLSQRFSTEFLNHTRKVLGESEKTNSRELVEPEETSPKSECAEVSPTAVHNIDSSVYSEPDTPLITTVDEGGIFAALWRLSLITRCGLTVYLKRIPIRQEVIEICNCLELDPYRIGGCKLEIPEDPKDAWQIGVLTDTNQKIIINGDDVRYLDRPQA